MKRAHSLKNLEAGAVLLGGQDGQMPTQFFKNKQALATQIRPDCGYRIQTYLKLFTVTSYLQPVQQKLHTPIT